jgi:anion transporter
VQVLHDVPLLSRLPRVELAKLVSDLRTVGVAEGDEIHPADEKTSYVYFIRAGKVGVFMRVEDTPITLMVLGPGEIFDEGQRDGPLGDKRFSYRAIEDATLYQLERSRFEGILTQHPALLRQFSEAVVQRSHLVLDELARTKSALMVHAAEVWSMVEGANSAMEMASAAHVQPAANAPQQDMHPKSNWSWRILPVHGFPVLAALAVLGVGSIYFGYSPVLACLSVLVWGVSTWLVDELPDYVVAMTIALLAIFLGIVKPEVAFSGFSNRTWFLLLAVLGISAGISRTGLLYRVALQMLRLFPATYTGQSTALALGGLLLAPFLPGVTGRQAMASRLSLELSEAMGFKPNSKGSAGLAMACFLGFSCIYYISMTGGSVTLMVWSVLPEATKAGLSWTSWFLAALPPSLFVFVATLVTIVRHYSPPEKLTVSRVLVDSQLRVLGPMNSQEWTTVWVVLAIVVAFITQPLHGIDPTWVAFPGFLLLCSTGIVDKDVLRRGIDWGFLLLTGGLLGLVAITTDSGLVQLLSGTLAPLIQPLASNPWIFLTAVALATTVIHLAVPFQPTILLTMLALGPVASRLGYNPFVIGLVVLVMASHFVIPHSNPMYMAAFGGSERRAFTHGQVRRLSLLHVAITLAAIWASIPLWRLMGLL